MNAFTCCVLPGIIFLTLGLSWSTQLVWELTRSRILTKGNWSMLASCSLPWEGILKLTLTGLGIIISVLVNQDSADVLVQLRMTTTYVAFAISGLTDMLVCFKMVPKGLQSLTLAWAFATEASLLSSGSNRDLIIVTGAACSLASGAEAFVENNKYLLRFCRSYFCVLRGTWLIHAGAMMPDSSTEWQRLLFTWHSSLVLAVFTSALWLTPSVARLVGSVSCSISREDIVENEKGCTAGNSDTDVTSHSLKKFEELPPLDAMSPLQYSHLRTLKPPPSHTLSSPAEPLNKTMSARPPDAETLKITNIPMKTPAETPTEADLNNFRADVEESFPNDQVSPLSREDQLRKSITVMESSLI